MSKDSHFTGQPVYSQVLKLLDKEKILQISRETKGSEAYVKRFDGYQHLVVMLFGILKHFDSLRELEIGMKAEAHKLGHLGMNYLVRRSTLAEANIRRPQEFFASVYAYLLEKYAKFLADSRPSKCYKGQTHEPKDWEKLLYMMDSTTITLFDNILKGVGRHPKSGKKKGGMKVHTVMKYHVGVPMVVQLTSAAKHDHYLLKEVHLPKDSTLAMDRGYVDIAQFQRLTEEGVCYVTKMKKNLKYEELESITYVNPQGLVTHIDKKVLFTRGELTHEARMVEIFYETKKPVVLLTNNFEFTFEDISEIYRLRWAIESLYKQLKQNFPLHFFYGDSVNAIQIQTWVVLIANLLMPDDLLHLAVIVHGFRQLIGGIQYLPGYEEGYQGSPIRLFLHAGRIPKQLDSVFFQFLVGHTCFLSYCGHFPLSGAALNGKWYRMVAMPGELRLIERSRTSLHYTPQSAFRPVCRKSCRHRRWRRRRRGSRRSG